LHDYMHAHVSLPPPSYHSLYWLCGIGNNQYTHSCSCCNANSSLVPRPSVSILRVWERDYANSYFIGFALKKPHNVGQDQVLYILFMMYWKNKAAFSHGESRTDFPYYTCELVLKA